MKYHYKQVNKIRSEHGEVYRCNHPLYNSCTLYLHGEKGLAVIQQRFNRENKWTWWGPIDVGLVDDIFNNERFEAYFNEKALKADSDGLYPTIPLRQLMWALRMKPLPKEPWETRF